MKKLLLSLALMTSASMFAAQQAESSLSKLEENFEAFETLEEGDYRILRALYPELISRRMSRDGVIPPHNIAKITKDMFHGILQKAVEVGVSDEEIFALIENLTHKKRNQNREDISNRLRQREHIDIHDISEERLRNEYIVLGQCWQILGISHENSEEASEQAVKTLRRLYDSIKAIELDRLSQFKFAD